MKKTLIIASTGVLVLSGLAFTAFNQWGPNSQENLTATDDDSINEIKQTTGNQSNSEGAQESNNTSYEIAFFVNEQAYRTKIVGNGFGNLTPVSNESELELIETEKYFTTSVMPQGVLKALPISKNMIFYSGLQSNLDPNLWFYTERVDEGSDFSVRSYNVSTKEEKILFSKKNSPNKKYGFKPFAISNDNAVLYLEAFQFDSYLNNEEIWTIDLNTMNLKKLNVQPFYNGTPAISPDGKYLLYPASSQPNDVHVTSNRLFLFDLENNKEIRVIADEKSYVGMKGWIKSN